MWNTAQCLLTAGKENPASREGKRERFSFSFLKPSNSKSQWYFGGKLDLNGYVKSVSFVFVFKEMEKGRKLEV